MEFSNEQLKYVNAAIHGNEYKLIDMAKKSGMIPALIPEFIEYMKTLTMDQLSIMFRDDRTADTDKKIRCFSEKYNGWTNYATWYLVVEISNREDVYFWIYDNLKDGSLTAGDVVNILKDGIKHPNAVYNPDALKGWLNNVSKEFNVKYERPYTAINWIEIYEYIKTFME